ncbi:MAG: hypothetical protein AAB706_00560 [Patescibacteria group bacterium]
MMPYKSISQLEICNLEVAQKRLIKKLVDNGFKIKIVFPINERRYTIITGIQDNEEKRIFLMFKKEFFHNFGMEFRHLGATGQGDTINVEDLKTALRLEVTDIYSVYPNGICYTIPLQDFLMKSIRWTNKEGKEVRSISIHELKRGYNLI